MEKNNFQICVMIKLKNKNLTNIKDLSDCNKIRTNNYLDCKRTLTKWLNGKWLTG